MTLQEECTIHIFSQPKLSEILYIGYILLTIKSRYRKKVLTYHDKIFNYISAVLIIHS